MIKSCLALALALLALWTGVPPAAAARPAPPPVAIVEAVSGGAAGLQPLDYLVGGQTLTLPAGTRLVIDYFVSCLRETIAGGTVKVGKSESVVSGGSVERAKYDCDRGGRAALLGVEEERGKPGFVPPPKPEGQPQQVGIDRTLYSTSPLFDLGGPGALLIEPLDPAGTALKLTVAAGELLRGRFYDFAAMGKTLSAGGIYRATLRGQVVVFWVDPLARDGASPPGGRLIRF